MRSVAPRGLPGVISIGVIVLVSLAGCSDNTVVGQRDEAPATQSPLPTSPPPTFVPATPTPVSTVTPVPIPDGVWMDELLRWMPLDYGNGLLELASYRNARTAAGVTDYKGIEIIDGRLFFNEPPSTYVGAPRHAGIWDYTDLTFQKVGFDIYEIDRGVWPRVSTPNNNFFENRFTIIEGGFEPNEIKSNLPTLGYVEESYNGVTYYRLYEGSPLDVERWRTHTLRHLLLDMNVVAPIGDWLVMGISVETVTGLIDILRGNASSLLENESYRTLAESFGETFIGGAMFTPDYVIKGWTEYDLAPLENLDRYVRDNSWDALTSYSAALIGYEVADGQERTVVAIYYPDPDAAEADAPELERRWKATYLNPPQLERKSPNVLYTGDGPAARPPYVRPVSDFCPEFTTRSVRHPDASVLIGSCTITPREDGQSSIPWVDLLNYHDLAFLVPNLKAMVR